MVYSHGTEGIYAVELNDAWDAYAGEPFKLFDVGGCGWATEAFGGMVLNDGPCFYETDSGKLICLFSTMSDNGYKMGYAVSSDGTSDVCGYNESKREDSFVACYSSTTTDWSAAAAAMNAAIETYNSSAAEGMKCNYQYSTTDASTPPTLVKKE